MTDRERFQNIMDYKPVDRMLVYIRVFKETFNLDYPRKAERIWVK